MADEEDLKYSKRNNWAFLILGIIIGAGIGAGISFVLNPGGSSGGFNGSVDIKGSDTLLELASVWAMNYSSQNPGVILTVSGGGSGTGIAALIAGTIDIATASRTAKPSEIEDAQSKGITLTKHVIVLDGIAIITNPSKPIWNITYEKLRGIFNGTITDWSQVNATYSGIIIPYSRQSTSGTYAYFQEEVMKNDDYGANVQQLAGNTDIINAVIHDSSGIGYVSAAYIEAAGSSINVVRVNNPDNIDEYYLPTAQNIRNLNYPISRYLYFYTNGMPTGYIQAFITWCQSPIGQSIAEEHGYVSIYNI
ncbi:MAG: phosphate ABC transporter substrate-binding protein [Candidatus Odinarchaeia archaeon]